MTRELTEAEIRVERDRLLEGGRTLEQVTAMQKSVTKFTQAEIRKSASVARLAWLHATMNEGDPWEQVVGSLFLLVCPERLEILSPPETPAGASAPRPQSPHEGMGIRPDPSSWRCVTCGLHACICDSFPGHGAG